MPARPRIGTVGAWGCERQSRAVELWYLVGGDEADVEGMGTVGNVRADSSIEPTPARIAEMRSRFLADLVADDDGEVAVFTGQPGGVGEPG